MPTLPVELVDTIVNNLAEEAHSLAPDSDPFEDLPSERNEAQDALKECSAVSQGFMFLSRPHLFRQVKVKLGHHLGFISGQDDRPVQNLDQLVRVLDSNERWLASAVRELYVRDEQHFQYKTRVPDTYRNALLQFPNLEALVIDRRSSFSVSDFDQELLDTYVHNSSTLTFLALAEFTGPIPFASFSTAANLETLHLKGCVIQAFTGPVLSAVKHLYVLDLSNDVFPLSFLSHFPSLKTLCIDEDYDATPPQMVFDAGTGDERCPSLDLEKLHLSAGPMTEGIHSVIDYFQTKATLKGQKAFASLKELTVGVSQDADLAALKRMLDDGPRLHSLIIYDMSPGADQGAGPADYDLDEHLVSSHSTLKTLSLHIPFIRFSPDADGLYMTVVNNLYALLHSLAGHNVIENLNVDIKLVFDDEFAFPPLAIATWFRVATILSTHPSFPLLKDVSLGISFVIEREDYGSNPRTNIDLFERGGMQDIKVQLESVFVPLSSRLDRPVQLFMSTSLAISYLPGYLREQMELSA
ncbi:hypothetical protein CVT24_003273 [Panaeolus cyanescens]|uniref:F-box domain-containing protein n=1 Tax=Panaeolus cyanescens TaxID=181874 RepID=A0A409YRA8_9AGAR|nr:hypothetical protein CVT24_003273 [Panaeolus cyanescens]